MNRARAAFAAALMSALAVPSIVLAQTAGAPELHPILADRHITPPIRGIAQVEFTSTKANREKDNIIEKFTVKNVSTAPIARLSINETWYDKGGAVLTGSKATVNGLLQPGEIQVLTLSTPFKPGMNSNQYVFAHANGTVKPTRVAKLEAPKK
jgi:hypothetical protein